MCRIFSGMNRELLILVVESAGFQIWIWLSGKQLKLIILWPFWELAKGSADRVYRVSFKSDFLIYIKWKSQQSWMSNWLVTFFTQIKHLWTLIMSTHYLIILTVCFQGTVDLWANKMSIVRSGCGRLMANGDYWGLMGICFHPINLNGDYWGLLGINGQTADVTMGIYG